MSSIHVFLEILGELYLVVAIEVYRDYKKNKILGLSIHAPP